MELGLVVDGGGRRARHLPVYGVCGVLAWTQMVASSLEVSFGVPHLFPLGSPLLPAFPLFPFLNSALVCWVELIPRSPPEASRDSARVSIYLSSPLPFPALPTSFLPYMRRASSSSHSLLSALVVFHPSHVMYFIQVPSLSLAWRMKLACITNLSHQPQ